MKQLAGMRGLIARPDGSNHLNLRIIANFEKKGLTRDGIFQFPPRGPRKALRIRLLKTQPTNGYLEPAVWWMVAQDCNHLPRKIVEPTTV